MSAMTHPCQLFLVIPSGPAAPTPDAVAAALASGAVACTLLEAAPGGDLDPSRAKALCALAKEGDTAFLIETDVDLAKSIGADGVQIGADEALYERARTALGGAAIVGADCGASRHAALSLAETGADYVAVTSSPADDRQARDDFVAWWAELVEVPLVAGLAEDIDAASHLRALGADFVAVRDAVWQHPGGPAQAVKDFTAVLSGQRTAA